MKLVLNTQRVKKELKRNGWSTYRFAVNLGCSQQAVSSILSKKHPQPCLKTISKWASVLLVDPKDLLITIGDEDV